MDDVQRRRAAADLVAAAEAMARLAEDDTVFRGVIDAFRAQDAESLQALLRRFELLPRCHLVCDWICSKECVLECLLLCGPPPEVPPDPKQIAEFAEVVARVTGDEELVERLAGAIEERDASAFRGLVEELNIQRFCHLLCHWACGIRCRLRCEIVCEPGPPVVRQFVAELARAGAVIGQLAADASRLEAVVAAAERLDCLGVGELVGQSIDCFVICEWICSWRCILVCLDLCRPFPADAIDTSIEEMRRFAQALPKLAADVAAVERLVAAVEGRNAEAYGAVVREFGLERFCIQLCHWVCFRVCQEFCVCICPPAQPIPLFTHVGQYRVDPIYGDFAGDGTTTAGRYAFTATIPLRGIIPDGTDPVALEYRFLSQRYPLLGSPIVPVDASMIEPTVIGELEFWYFAGGTWRPGSADYYVNLPAGDPRGIASIPQQFGPPLQVPVNKDVKAGGWIEVPRENQLYPGGIGQFRPEGGLADLITSRLTLEQFDLTVNVPPLPVRAGDAVPPGEQSVKPTFKLFFEARNVATLAAAGANDLEVIALSNTEYTYVRHPEWVGGAVTTAPVASLDIAELAPGGCVELGAHLHALFTAYHPYLGAYQVYLEGPGIPPQPPVNPAFPAIAGGEAISTAGGQAFDISGLRPCAYILWLSATLDLTSGYGQVPWATFYDHIAFCKR